MAVVPTPLAALLAQSPMPGASSPGVGMVPPGAMANLAMMMKMRGRPGMMPQAGGGLPFGMPGAVPQAPLSTMNNLGSLQAAVPYAR